jgi:hypothetical protein
LAQAIRFLLDVDLSYQAYLNGVKKFFLLQKALQVRTQEVRPTREYESMLKDPVPSKRLAETIDSQKAFHAMVLPIWTCQRLIQGIKKRVKSC